MIVRDMYTCHVDWQKESRQIYILICLPYFRCFCCTAFFVALFCSSYNLEPTKQKKKEWIKLYLWRQFRTNSAKFNYNFLLISNLLLIDIWYSKGLFQLTIWDWQTFLAWIYSFIFFSSIKSFCINFFLFEK